MIEIVEENNKNERGRHFLMLFYEEHLNNNNIFKKLEKYDILYLAILHNKDFLKTGEKAKEHYHIIISFENARFLGAVANLLDIDKKFIQKINNLNDSILYLTHFKVQDKNEYDIEELIYNNKRQDLFVRYCNLVANFKINNDEKTLFLLNYIENNNCCSVIELMRYALINDCSSMYHRYQNSFINIIKNNYYNLLERREKNGYKN